jgi:tagatose-1,6-bisphosphate aldolase/sugar (pentulose or hexulose) kinase
MPTPPSKWNGVPALNNTLVAGLDLGSTGIKILVADGTGAEVFVRQLPTPWESGPGGTTVMAADALIGTVRQLFESVAELLKARYGASCRVGALAVSGMGESGILLNNAGVAAAPAIAWFDPRGAEQILALPDALRKEFAGRTGMPLGVQVSVIKMLHLRDQGLDLTDTRWLSLPEYVVAALGGDQAAEYSLASRTGLIDQDTGAPWPALLDYLGVAADFLPPLTDAGTFLGNADAGWLPAVFADAELTVAGHDHLVSAVSTGDFPADRYHVSIGTAEVLLRVLDRPLSFAARERLADRLINCVRHVVPDTWVLVAGVKTGLLMRRALQLHGITDRVGRDRLDEQIMQLPLEGNMPDGDIEVSGARNDDGVLRLTIRGDGADPAETFNAVLRHSNDEIQLLIDAMDRELPPARSSLMTGGWAAMRSVLRARSTILPELRVSDRAQDTAYGASLFAQRLVAASVEVPDARVVSVADPQSSHPARTSPFRAQENPMNTLTTLERRAMATISTPGGGMLIVAADQRNGMKAVMTDAPNGASSISADELADAKADLLRYLGNKAPAILLDPEVALPLVVDDATISRNTGLVVGMDASGFEVEAGLRRTRYVEGMSARKVRDLGGDAAKMLFYLRSDQRGSETVVIDEIRRLAAACDQEGVLLIVEILVYQLEDESDEDYRAIFPELVRGAAEISVAAGAKVLKLQYPGSPEACAAVTAAADGVPWAVLSAGVDHERFVGQVRAAVENGASGAMAGRSLWKDSLSVSSAIRRELLTTRALPRLQELEQVIDAALSGRA